MINEKKRSSLCYISIILVLVASSTPKKCSAFLGIDVDKFMFNCSIGVLKMSVKAAFYAAINSPRMMLLMAALYFHKEIAQLLKDYFMYFAGEYPIFCCAVGSVGLLYLMHCLSQVCPAAASSTS